MKWLNALLLVAWQATPLTAQQVSTSISRDTIRVGDPFRVIVRVDVPVGTEVTMPDSVPAAEDLENAGTMRIRRDTANGVLRIAAAYSLMAWRPGQVELPPLRVFVKSPEGDSWRIIGLPQIDVLSVLPADTTNIKAKPPKDVIGPNRLWWPWLLAALLLLLVLAAAYWWYRKRRRAEPAAVPLPAIMPREQALEELERIRKLGLIEEQSFGRYYVLLTQVLRQYMATAEPTWSTDLTTEELARKHWKIEDIRPAVSVLRSSDMVKFARHAPTQADALRDYDRTRDWIMKYPAPAPAPATAERAA